MTKRDYVGRMMDEKVHCMLKAKEYEADYWDGDRRYGYGGYRYIEGAGSRSRRRWSIGIGSKAGAHPRCRLRQGLSAARVQAAAARGRVGRLRHLASRTCGRPSRREDNLFRYRAQDRYPFGDKSFDLVVSLGTLHNLKIFELQTAIEE